MTKIPPPSSPRVFSTGTLTLSNVTYAVPAVAEYAVLMGFVSTPSPRSTRMTVNPSCEENQSVYMEAGQGRWTCLSLASYGEAAKGSAQLVSLLWRNADTY